MPEQLASTIDEAKARAEHLQAEEERAEARFDAVRAQAQAAGTPERAQQSAEFREWMACRHRTDDAWGAWWTALGQAQPAAG